MKCSNYCNASLLAITIITSSCCLAMNKDKARGKSMVDWFNQMSRDCSARDDWFCPRCKYKNSKEQTTCKSKSCFYNVERLFGDTTTDAWLEQFALTKEEHEQRLKDAGLLFSHCGKWHPIARKCCECGIYPPMWECSCGRYNYAEEDTKCRECGKQMPKDQPIIEGWTCSKCSAKNFPFRKHCEKCNVKQVSLSPKNTDTKSSSEDKKTNDNQMMVEDEELAKVLALSMQTESHVSTSDSAS